MLSCGARCGMQLPHGMPLALCASDADCDMMLSMLSYRSYATDLVLRRSACKHCSIVQVHGSGGFGRIDTMSASHAASCPQAPLSFCCTVNAGAFAGS